MDCGTCFAKYILCLFNFIIFLGGGTVLAVGVWLYVDKDSFLSVTKAVDYNTLPQLEQLTQPEVVAHISYALMAAGGIIFILSLLGYCGALRESRCLLGFYGFLLVVILVLEITAAGLAYAYMDKAETEVKTFLKDTIENYYTTEKGNENGPTLVWNYLMTEMSCCGVDNYTDFYISDSFKQTGKKVPEACCKMTSNTTLLDRDCPKSPKIENSFMFTGCYNTIMDRIQEHMNIVIYVVIGIIIVELLSTFLAFCLCKSLEPYDK